MVQGLFDSLTLCLSESLLSCQRDNALIDVNGRRSGANALVRLLPFPLAQQIAVRQQCNETSRKADGCTRTNAPRGFSRISHPCDCYYLCLELVSHSRFCGLTFCAKYILFLIGSFHYFAGEVPHPVSSLQSPFYLSEALAGASKSSRDSAADDGQRYCRFVVRFGRGGGPQKGIRR